MNKSSFVANTSSKNSLCPHRGIRQLLVSVFVLLLTACGTSSQWKETIKEADLAKAAGDLGGCIKLQIKALKEMEQNKAPKDLQIKIMSNLAHNYMDARNYKDAMEYAAKSVATAEIVYGPDDSRLLPLLGLQRLISKNLASREESDRLISKMIDVQKKVSGSDSVPVMWLLDDYARSNSPSCGDKFDPQKLRELVKLREKFCPKNDPATVLDKLILADILSQMKLNDEAENNYKSSLASARQNPQARLNDCLYRYGKFLNKQKRYAESLPLLQEVAKNVGPKSDKFSLNESPDVIKEYVFVLEQSGRKHAAVKVCDEMIAALKDHANKGLTEEFEQLKDQQKG